MVLFFLGFWPAAEKLAESSKYDFLSLCSPFGPGKGKGVSVQRGQVPFLLFSPTRMIWPSGVLLYQPAT